MRVVICLFSIFLNYLPGYKHLPGLLAAFFLLSSPGSAQSQAPWRDQGVIHVDASQKALLHSVPVRAVRFGEGFWQERRRVTLEKSVPTLLQLMEENGVLDNFRRLSQGKNVPRRGPLYTDSDLYKWMEAVAFFLQEQDSPELRRQFDEIADLIAAAQEPSGYLNTYYVDDRLSLRWSEMYRGHELYCLGHLMQAAVAYYRATGNRRLLDVTIKFADHLVADFGPGKKPLLAGHPEIELALVELYRTTGEKKYLDLAQYILTGDPRLNLQRSQIVYLFSGIPFPERRRFEGHAVRALYAASGATDYYLETGDAAYWPTLQTLFEDLARTKLYITGGVGSRATGEAFGEPYELPNQLAYTESCAAIGAWFWNWRMLAATAAAPHADVMERALYNGINSGMSLNGTLYCYRNPLELAGNPEDKIRNPWYSTTCCPPNLERVFASLPGYLYSTSAAGVYVHFFHNSTLDWKLEDGTPLRIEQKTEYPWKGEVDLTVHPSTAREFTLFVRIPSWTGKASVTVNGSAAGASPQPGSYYPIRRNWRPGDRVTLTLDMTPRLIAANPRVADNYGKAAVERGPIVYAMEGLDQPSEVNVLDVSLAAGAGARFKEEFRPDFLGGIVLLRHPGLAPAQPASTEPLYQPLARSAARALRNIELSLIPYYTFANREPTPMRVWIPVAAKR